MKVDEKIYGNIIEIDRGNSLDGSYAWIIKFREAAVGIDEDGFASALSSTIRHLEKAFDMDRQLIMESMLYMLEDDDVNSIQLRMDN